MKWNGKSLKCAVSLPEDLEVICKRQADRLHGGNFSRLVQGALVEHLERHNLLELDPLDSIVALAQQAAAKDIEAARDALMRVVRGNGLDAVEEAEA